MNTAVATQREQSPRDLVRHQLNQMDSEIEAVLPEHVSLKKFKRVILTAIGRNPELIEADRASLFAACLDCAQDGLVPDGRKAALVVFKTKDRATGGWIKKVQYMPMIAGVYDKVRNTGEIATLSAHVVHADEPFEYWIDEDGPHLRHNPILVGPRGETVLVYAICRLKDGSVEMEAMTKAEVEEVRAVSKAAGGSAWSNWWGEMARKTVVRRLSKRLPMSSDQQRVLRRDDSMYDLEQEKRPAVDAPPRPRRVEYQPEPPAQEDLDAQYRRATKGIIPDEPEEHEGAPAGESPDLVVDGYVILLGCNGMEIGRYKAGGHYFNAVRAQFLKEEDPRGFLELNHDGAQHFVSQDEKWQATWEGLWANANEADAAQASVE